MLRLPHYEAPPRFHQLCSVQYCDTNAILAGKVEARAYGQAILAFDRQATASGSGIIACKAGANRSGSMAVGFVMAKTKCSPQEALRYLVSIRPIVDISEARGGMAPMDFLAKWQEAIWGLFPVPITLPISIWPEDFRSMCTGHWDSVPEYIKKFCKVSDHCQPTSAVEQWLNHRRPSPRRQNQSQATGSADGPADGPADAGVQAGRL